MTLLERCKSLREKRKRLVSLQGKTQETTALQLHASKLNDIHTEFSRAVEVRRALLNEEIPLQTLGHQKVQEVAEALRRIRERFTINPSRQALVADNDWPTITSGVKELTSSIKDCCRHGWSNFTDDFFAKASIVENMVVKTDSNVARLQEYKKLLREMQFLVNDWDSNDSVRTFKSKGKRLSELAKGLNEFHAPDDVKKFLEAVSTNGGAPLELLTKEVVVWLKEQNMFSKYKIIGGC
jgi:hypothetical protein